MSGHMVGGTVFYREEMTDRSSPGVVLSRLPEDCRVATAPEYRVRLASGAFVLAAEGQLRRQDKGWPRFTRTGRRRKGDA